MSWLLGFDLGGTKLATAIVSDKGKIAQQDAIKLELEKYPTPKSSQQRVLSLMKDCVVAAKKYKIKAIGVASAGPMNVDKGELIEPTNFRGWKKFAIVKELKNELKKAKVNLPIYFQNDAMAAALGEGWVGGAKGLHTYVVITLGTGIGTGMIYKGHPAQTGGMGGEWGLQIIDKTNIKFGESHHMQTVEGFACGPAIVKRAAWMGFRGHRIEELVAAINSGENQYRQLFSDAAKGLAVLCYNLSLGFNPQKILFSGGLINIKELFWEELQKRYEELLTPNYLSFRTPLAIAKLGTKAGVIGAARLPLLKS